MKKEGKMHPDPHKLSSKTAFQGRIGEGRDIWGIRYDESVSFPLEVAIWRKSGENDGRHLFQLRKMDEAASRAEIVRVLAPIRKEKKR
jgi:hypothetical protein